MKAFERPSLWGKFFLKGKGRERSGAGGIKLLPYAPGKAYLCYDRTPRLGDFCLSSGAAPWSWRQEFFPGSAG